MTIDDLQKQLSAALMDLDHNVVVPGSRVEEFAREIERLPIELPNPGSWRFSANRLRDTRDDPANLRKELVIAIAKLEHYSTQP